MLTPALPGSRPRVIPVRARFAATRSSAASDADAAGRSARFTRNPAGPRESLLEDGEADSGSKEVAPPLAPTRGPGSLLVLNLVCSSRLLLLVSPRSCSWASPAGPHYSLAGLYNSKQDYIFHDNFNLDTYNFTFTVQMCGNVNNPPPACAPPGRMAYRSCTSGTCASQCTSVALDYNTKPTPITYTYHGSFLRPRASPVPLPRLARHVGRENAARSRARADPTKPGSGWNVTYLGPAIAGCPSNTAFTVAHLCADQAFPAAGTTFNTLVRLVNDCQYEAYVPSLAGCPAECPLGKNGRLCSGQGICQYDTDLGNARCFCDNGFIEKDCSAPYDPTPAGPVVGAVFGGLFLGAGLVGGYWWFMKRTPTREPEMGYYNAPLDG